MIIKISFLYKFIWSTAHTSTLSLFFLCRRRMRSRGMRNKRSRNWLVNRALRGLTTTTTTRLSRYSRGSSEQNPTGYCFCPAVAVLVPIVEPNNCTVVFNCSFEDFSMFFLKVCQLCNI